MPHRDLFVQRHPSPYLSFHHTMLFDDLLAQHIFSQYLVFSIFCMEFVKITGFHVKETFLSDTSFAFNKDEASSSLALHIKMIVARYHQ